MTLKSTRNQTIALAGIAQACFLVRQQATGGSPDSLAMTASIASVLKIDAGSIEDIYGGLAGLKLGLSQLDTYLSGQLGSTPEPSRHAAQLIYLQGKLAKQPTMVEKIRCGILRAQTQAESFGILHQNVLANLADVYHSTISTLQPRIMVTGNQLYLGDQNSVNKIRALLLAGIRSAQLWRQCGGSRWHLLMMRRSLQQQARLILAEI